ncbi:LptF/LptG permease family protein [Lyticum sinuosum]|uniref:hypothetical protein n=1 Tax=Lyticum sinuosum TaxID=1332059 RepID=UPI002ACD4627|nr:hypothetical protein [Lyticum sinuosum]
MIILSTQIGLSMEFALQHDISISLNYLLIIIYHIPNILFNFLPFISVLSATSVLLSSYKNTFILNSLGLTKSEIFIPFKRVAFIIFIIHESISLCVLPIFNKEIILTELTSVDRYLQDKISINEIFQIENNLVIFFSKNIKNKFLSKKILKDILILNRKNDTIIIADSILFSTKSESNPPKNTFKYYNTDNITTNLDKKSNIEKKLDQKNEIIVEFFNGKIISTLNNQINQITTFKKSNLTIKLPQVNQIYNKFTDNTHLTVKDLYNKSNFDNIIYNIQDFYNKSNFDNIIYNIQDFYNKSNFDTNSISNSKKLTNKYKLILLHRIIWPMYNIFLVNIMLSIIQIIKSNPRKSNIIKIFFATTVSFIIIIIYFSINALLKNNNNAFIISIIMQISILLITKILLIIKK